MPRPLIIAVLGVDGAGKTTQSKLLAAWLSAEGVPASYFENPGGRRVTDRLAGRLGRGDTRGLLGSSGQVVVEIAVRTAALARARISSQVTGRVAVMDRYSYCQYALIRARVDRGERLARAILRWFRAPDAVFFLSVTEDVAQHRVEVRGYDREELDYLAAFTKAYWSLPEATTFQRLDATGSIDEVQARLREAVGSVVRP